MMKAIRCAALVLMLAPTIGSAQDFDAGLNAFVDGNYDTAMAIWSAAAARGVAQSQLGIGMMFEDGNGIEQNFSVAARWYRQAAEQGHTPGQRSLARLYMNGLGVPQNTANALLWYRAAAEQSDAFGQFELGNV